MKAVLRRKQKMVGDLIKVHLDRYEKSGTELIMGDARFVAPRTVQITFNDGGTRTISGERVFFSLCTRAAVPGIPGLADARPMTHVELLELDRVPAHLVVLGGGYVGLELAQAMRRFGARTTIIERGDQLAGREDADVGEAILNLFKDEGIEVLLNAEVPRGRTSARRFGSRKRQGRRTSDEATDFLIAAGGRRTRRISDSTGLIESGRARLYQGQRSARDDR